MPSVPDRAQVVIVGGGIVGASIAYHLTRREITDVVVLEQNTLTAGTTWHAAGLVSQLKSTQSLTKLAAYSARLFEELLDRRIVSCYSLNADRVIRLTPSYLLTDDDCDHLFRGVHDAVLAVSAR